MALTMLDKQAEKKEKRSGRRTLPPSSSARAGIQSMRWLDAAV
jgi:hypothetical protein